LREQTKAHARSSARTVAKFAKPSDAACTDATLLSSLAMKTLALLASFALVAACGGETPAVKSPEPSADARATSASHPCGVEDKVHAHDLHSEGTTEALVPCSASGGHDYSGAIKIETIPEGVHIIIHATDDQVNMGMLGADVKTRDAVIVYPRGRG